MANRITDTRKLSEGLVWCRLTYDDGSEFCFQTTLNPNILRQYNIVLQEGYLPRLDKKYLWNGEMVYRQFPFKTAVISLWDESSYSDIRSAELSKFL